MMLNLKLIVHQFQETFSINKLTELEKSGVIKRSSFIKFFRGSLLELPFSLGRTIRGSSFDNTDLDPFIDILIDQDFENFDVDKFTYSLHKYYLDEKLKTVDNFLEIGNPEIKNLPSWAIAYPWEDLGFYDLSNTYMKLLANNREKYMSNNNSLAQEIKNSYVNYARSHGEQFKKLGRNIYLHGFDKSLPRPRIYILKNDKNWRWIMAGDGNHRAYIMSVLKKPVLPVVVRRVIDRSKSYKWPNVIRGEYTQKEAEHIFDIVFRGDARIRGCF